MSVQYLLDGYNIIHQVPQWTSKSLEEQRNSLIDWIKVNRPQGSVKNNITIIFDGKSGFLSPYDIGDVKVIYSQNRSADDKIIEMVEKSSRPKDIIVITDDRQIQISVKHKGAKVISVQEFYKTPSVAKSKKATLKGSAKDKSILSQTQEYDINRELEQIWLKKKSKNEKDL